MGTTTAPATPASLRSLAAKIADTTAALDALRAERAAQLVELHQRGASLRELAADSGVTAEMVRRIVGVRGEWMNLTEISAHLGLDPKVFMRRALEANARPTTVEGAPRWRAVDVENLRNL